MGVAMGLSSNADLLASECSCFCRAGTGQSILLTLACPIEFRSRRAAWAAQLLAEQGFSSCYVYKDGVYGWHLDPAIKSYASYDPGDEPPEPETFEVEMVDLPAAIRELADLGLLPGSS